MNLIKQQQNTALSTEVYQKRFQLYNAMRERSKDSIMRLIRGKYLKEQRDDDLAQLIFNTQYSVNQKQFQTLVKYAKQGLANAVIHIGNLFIDEILNSQLFQVIGVSWLMQIDPKTCYLQWLLLVLTSLQILDTSCKIYVKMVVVLKQSRCVNQDRILYALKCLNLFGKLAPDIFIQDFIVRHFEEINIQQLFKNIFSSNEKIVQQTWKLAALILRSEDQNILSQNSPVVLIGVNKLISLIKNGSISVQPRIRSISCQIMTNNLQFLLGIFSSHQDVYSLKKIIDLVELFMGFVLYPLEKDKVKMEVSFLLVNFCEIASLDIIGLAVEKGMMKVIKELENMARNVNNPNEQILQNCKMMSLFLYRRCVNYHQINCYNDQFLIEKILCEMNGLNILPRDFEIDDEMI